MNYNRLREHLKRDEGVRESAYQDSEGYLTIGVGRLIDARKGGRLSPKEIEYLLGNDIDRAIVGLRRRMPKFDDLNDVRQECLINMAFNLGLNGLFLFEKMFAAIDRQDWSDVAREALNSKWARQVGNRAIRIAEAMATGEFA